MTERSSHHTSVQNFDDMYNYLWYFLIFSFIGWCTEVGFHAVKSGRFVNRGFLNGPLCPIYGIGVCSAGILLGTIENIVLLFLASMAVATAVELAVGFLMDKIFRSKWWDYSSEKYNLYGYICPKFSLAWGVLCAAAVKLLKPIDVLVSYLKSPVSVTFLIIFFVILFIDAVATSIGVFKFNKRLMRLDQIAGEISAKITKGSDFIGNGVYKGTVKVYEEYEKAVVQAVKVGVRIIDAFPTFKSDKYNEEIQVIRKRLEEVREKRSKNKNSHRPENNENGTSADKNDESDK